MFLDGSNYKFKIEMDGQTWTHNFGTSKPACEDLNGVSLSYTGSAGQCQGLLATLTVAIGCTLDGCPCENLPIDWAVDLGIGGWVDLDNCLCDQMFGVFVAEAIGTSCLADVQSDVSLCSSPFDTTSVWRIEVSHELVSGPSTYRLIVLVTMNVFSGSSIRQAKYRSLPQDFDDEPDCLFLADVEDKITLSLFSDTWDDPSHPPCTLASTMPATIEVWDANA